MLIFVLNYFQDAPFESLYEAHCHIRLYMNERAEGPQGSGARRGYDLGSQGSHELVASTTVKVDAEEGSGRSNA